MKHNSCCKIPFLSIKVAISVIAALSCISSASTQTASANTKSSAAKAYSPSYIYDLAAGENPAQTESQKKKAPLRIQNPDEADSDGVTLLMKAVKSGNDWEIQRLLYSGADIQKRDNDGWSALMYAARYQNDSQIAKTLISNGAHMRIRNKFNSTPLLMAATYSQNPDVLALFLKNRSNAEDEVFHAFIQALTSPAGADYIRQAKLQLFLDMGVPVNRLWKGKTPLMYACAQATSTDVIRLLLENGAVTSVRDADGRTASDYAADNTLLAHDETYWKLNGKN